MKYYCLNFIVNINSYIALNISVNTTLKYPEIIQSSRQDLNKTLKLMRVVTNAFLKKLLGHDIFRSMVPCVTKFHLKNL